MDIIQITIGAGAALPAGYFIKDVLRRVRQSRPSNGDSPSLRGTVDALQSIVTRLEGLLRNYPAMEGQVQALETGHRRMAADIEDIRRESSEMDHRVRKLEKRDSRL